MKTFKVSIVDDDQHARKRIGYLLDEFVELQVLGSYSNAENAIKAMIIDAPDILFADIEMPCMDGIEMVSKLREKGCNPIIIFITGHDHYAIKAIKQQAFDYILKPVDVMELRETINRLLDVKLNFKNINKTLPELTAREKQIVRLLADGLSSKEIGEALHLSKNTIDTYRRQLLRKTSTQNTTELVALYL